MRTKGLTERDSLLLVASGLLPTFSEYDLTVRAWAFDWERYGLKGCKETHPDHKRVMASLLQNGGPVKKGLIRRVRPNTYTLTTAGRERLAALPPLTELVKESA